ncbi:MAG: hypothetical protein QM809_11245 [Gordonia sp. (in: high G+C Gram-positive bacteria)]|uniref:hypothetical protein n=1 Tax=Gordonia sp. (in: high G+C Gram-positive bacteria) TaxID=84139 RepID=UPI0039E4CF4A
MVRWRWRRRRAPRDAAAELRRARVLVECHDEAASSSSFLNDAGFTRTDEVLLRHLVFVPDDASERFLTRLAGDGYVPAPALPSDPAPPAGLVAVAVGRVQRVDGQSLSRERSLIASMAARGAGVVGGWAVLEATVDEE